MELRERVQPMTSRQLAILEKLAAAGGELRFTSRGDKMTAFSLSRSGLVSIGDTGPGYLTRLTDKGRLRMRALERSRERRVRDACRVLALEQGAEPIPYFRPPHGAVEWLRAVVENALRAERRYREEGKPLSDGEAYRMLAIHLLVAAELSEPASPDAKAFELEHLLQELIREERCPRGS